jgi:hypothetical protein
MKINTYVIFPIAIRIPDVSKTSVDLAQQLLQKIVDEHARLGVGIHLTAGDYDVITETVE